MGSPMTRVYRVLHADGVSYVPTKAEALRLARQERQLEFETSVYQSIDETPVTITAVDITARLGRRELYCALLNNESFADHQEEVPL